MDPQVPGGQDDLPNDETVARQHDDKRNEADDPEVKPGPDFLQEKSLAGVLAGVARELVIARDGARALINYVHRPKVVHVDEEVDDKDDEYDDAGVLQCTPTPRGERRRYADTSVNRDGDKNPDREVQSQVDDEGVELAGEVRLESEVLPEDVVQPETQETGVQHGQVSDGQHGQIEHGGQLPQPFPT